MTQEELKILMKVAKKLAPKYSFGFYDNEDIEQECYFLALEAFEKYDSTIGSLENFLYTHLNNRLKNFLRKHYYRRSFTCVYCGGKDEKCPHCEKRRLRFATKKHLVEPLDIDRINCNHEANAYTSYDFLQKMEIDEIFSLINKELEIELRMDYLKMLEGLKISKKRKDIIEERIMQILQEHGYGE